MSAVSSCFVISSRDENHAMLRINASVLSKKKCNIIYYRCKKTPTSTQCYEYHENDGHVEIVGMVTLVTATAKMSLLLTKTCALSFAGDEGEQSESDIFALGGSNYPVRRVSGDVISLQ